MTGESVGEWHRKGFYEDPRNERGFTLLDGWGDVHATGGQRLTGRYAPRPSGGKGVDWPTWQMLGFGEVERLLDSVGRPGLLVWLLGARYPRTRLQSADYAAVHKATFWELATALDGQGSDVNVLEIRRLMLFDVGELARFLEECERRVVRRLRKGRAVGGV